MVALRDDSNAKTRNCDEQRAARPALRRANVVEDTHIPIHSQAHTLLAVDREIELDGREDHFERRQIAAQVVEAKDRVADFIKQRLSLIRADQDTVSSHAAFPSSP